MKRNCFICCDVDSVQEIIQKNVPCETNLTLGPVYADLKTSHCSSCGSIFATEEQMSFNVEAVKEVTRQKENIVNRKTLLQRLAGSNEVEETIHDFGTIMGPGKYLH